MDVDDDYAIQEQDSDPVHIENDNDDDEVEQTQPERKTGKSRGSIYDALDDDDDDEEEEEEEGDHRGRKRAKVRVLCNTIIRAYS